MAPGPETRSPGQLARESIEALFDRRDFEEVRTLWTEETVDHILPLGFDLRGPGRPRGTLPRALRRGPRLRDDHRERRRGRPPRHYSVDRNGHFRRRIIQGNRADGQAAQPAGV